MNESDAATLKSVGSNIRAERARVGLSQEELAGGSHLGTAQLARMERGETDTGITKYVRVARALGVPVSKLFEGVDFL
jgi:transcriptional regulator with XRE-family HTH domain